MCYSKLSDKSTAALFNAELLKVNTCPLLNISQCAESETANKKFIVTVYNPLSRSVDKIVRLPILGTGYSVQDPYGNITAKDLR